MASCNSNKAPPLLSSCKAYDDWCKLVRVWTKFTNLPPEKQGAAMFLSLNGEALDPAFELKEEVINGKDGVKSIMPCLDKLYKKDDTLVKFLAMESFETYKRPSTLSIPEYINEFNKCLHKVKNYGAGMLDDILSYHLLKNANLKQIKEQLITATISDLCYNLMKKQLKKIFSDLSSSGTNMIPLPGEIIVKTEETNQIECDSDSDTEDLLYTKSHNYKDHRFTKSPHYAKKTPTNFN